MKISGFEVNSVRIQADNPLVAGVKGSDATRGFVTLELYTDEGVTGIGVSFIPGNSTIIGFQNQSICSHKKTIFIIYKINI